MAGTAHHMRLLFETADAEVFVEQLGTGGRRISVIPKSRDTYVHRATVETTYTDGLLEKLLTAKGAAFLCDEIARDQDPDYLERHLAVTIRAHLDPAELAGRDVLDFGCGAGASSSILGRVLPGCLIDGVDLDAANLRAAEARVAFHNLENVNFWLAPAGDELPERLGLYHLVVLSAVFEHLLPDERRQLMPALWMKVRRGGYLLIDETPWRWFPIESHTTGIPMLNYLPARVARRLALRSAKLRGRTTWQEMQRAGIRGGTVREVVASLAASPGEAHVLRPARLGIKDPVELWYQGYVSGEHVHRRWTKHAARRALSLLHSTTRIAAVPYLSLVIQKRSV